MRERRKGERALPKVIGLAVYILVLFGSFEFLFLPELSQPGTAAQRLLFDGILFLVVLPFVIFLVVDAFAKRWFS